MPALFVFLLKVNIALIAFCLGYYLVLRRLTFYTLNRIYLILAIIFASIYPFININGFIRRHQQLAPLQQAVLNLKAPAEKLLTYPWYWNWAAAVFWIGAAFFAMRLVIQFLSLYKIYRDSEPGNVAQYDVRITDADISPFSFWRSIFINPQNIEAADLKSILQHEQVHVNEWHTLDILLAEISVIFYWFNPGIWLMKKAVSENIEFITDRKILQQGTDSKAYQYSLLNVSLGVNASPNITNHFNFSTLKKRILMMNARRSSNANLTRYAVLVPLVVVCLCIFSVTKSDVVNSSKVAYNTLSDRLIQWTHSPLAEVAVKAKRIKRHKFFVLFADTSKKTAVPLTFRFLNDSIAHKNLTFQIKKEPGAATVYTINDKPVTADEFKAARPHGDIQTINIITDNVSGGRRYFTGIPAPPDGPGIKGNLDEPATKTAMIAGKTNGSVRIVEDVLLTPPVKDSIENHPPKAIHVIRLNGKNISKNELDKLPASVVEKIRVVDNKPQGYNTKEDTPASERLRDVEITTRKQPQ